MFVRKTLLSSVAALAMLGCAAAAQAQAGPTLQTIGADVRTTLSPGIFDAGTAISGMALEHAVPPPPGFFDPEMIFTPPTTQAEAQALSARMQASPDTFSVLAMSNTDMAWSNGKLFVGNFNGFNAYDVSSGAPKLVKKLYQ